MAAGPLKPRFDVGPLRAPVDAAVARRESRERIAREGRRFGVGIASAWTVLQTVVLIVGAGVLAALCVVAVQLLFGAHGADVTTVVLAALMVGPLAVARIRALIRGPREREAEEATLSRFAAANGMRYVTGELAPSRLAALFGVGTSRVASDVLTAETPRAFETANYAFDEWAARARFPRTACFVAFELRTALPPMALVNTSKELPACRWAPPASQTPLAIEGAAGSRFEVFCAPADADAVRRVLGADAQTALVEAAASADVEVVGGRVYVIARRQLPMTDPAFWEWVEDLAGLVSVLEGVNGDASSTGASDAARRSRRAALFAAPKAGRTSTVGCLLPLLVGLGLAAVITVAVNG